SDVHVDGALVRDLFGIAPQVFQQFFAANGTGAVFHQEVQQLEFLESQVQGFAIQVHFAARQVDQHTRWAWGRWTSLGAWTTRYGWVAQGLADDVNWITLRAGWSQRYRSVGLRLRRQGSQESAYLSGQLAQRSALCLRGGFIQTHVEHESSGGGISTWLSS